MPAAAFAEGKRNGGRAAAGFSGNSMKEQDKSVLRNPSGDRNSGVVGDVGGPEAQTHNMRRLILGFRARTSELEIGNERLRNINRELARSRKKYRELYHGSPAGYFSTDLHGTILEANHAFASMVGADPGRLIQIPLSDVVILPDRAAFDDYFPKLIAHGKARIARLRVHRHDGGQFAATLSGVLAKEETAGVPRRIRHSIVDIGDVLKAEDLAEKMNRQLANVNAELNEKIEKLRIAKENLEALDKKKNEFLSIASHELRVPLGTIIGFAQTLLSKEIALGEGDREKYTGIILSEGRRLNHLLQELLSVARMENNSAAYNLKEIQICNLVREVIREMRLPPDILIKTNGIDSLQCLVTADWDKVKQVLINLIDNAARFSDSGDSITISVLDNFDTIRIGVKDQGPGIRDEDKNRIFEKYYNVRQKNEHGFRNDDGMGLGLAIAKEIVNSHGGHIWVDSEFGKGSHFFFTLPKAAVH